MHWDADLRSLYGPPPRKLSRAMWLLNILCAARYQGWELLITEETESLGIGPDAKAEMMMEVGRSPSPVSRGGTRRCKPTLGASVLSPGGASCASVASIHRRALSPGRLSGPLFCGLPPASCTHRA